MSVTLKDLIHEFAPDQTPDAPSSAESAVAAPAYDGPTALFMTDFLDAVEALCTVLEEESACIAAGMLSQLEVYARRKLAMVERLESVGEQARAAAISLPEDLRTMTLGRIERLNKAVNENATGLAVLRKAALTINRNLLSALEKAASDGLYASSGQAIRPVELSASGLNTTL